MSDGEVPTLEVGFAINPQFDALRQVQEAMSSTEGRVVAEAARIEKATSGMLQLGGAAAGISSFGNMASRELASVARETNKVEKAGEAMVRQLEREVSTFGKSATEIRKMRAELRATEADGKGLTELAARIRAASAEIERMEQSTGKLGKSRGSMTQLSFQLNDIATMAASGAPAMQIFATQAGQIVQVVQQAEGGLKGFAGELGTTLLRFAPLAIGIGVAAGAFALFDRQVSKGIDTSAMVNDLGLTRAEIEQLKNVSVTSGDTIKATFQVIAQRVGISLGDMGKWFGQAMDWMTTAGRNALAVLYSSFVGTFRAIGAIVRGVFDGKGISDILSDAGDAYKGAFKEANSALTSIGQDVNKQLRSNKLADLQKQAAAIKADRTPARPKIDRQAEKLARDAEATSAQIRNLYAVADAYKVSGAAALVAEARVKAESQAIKQRGDIDASINRQVQLSIAQRVADGAKATAATREQAIAQEQVNAMVASGLAGAERAADLVQGRIADLPLLAAIEVAQQRGLTDAAEQATRALKDQQAVRERMRAAQASERFNSMTAAGNDRLAELREELRLVGATDMERVKALATVRATREAEQLNAGDRAAYIAQQVAIAAEQQRLTDAQREYNDALGFTANQWDLIATNVQRGAQGMADAFGRVGDAIGGMASIFAGYRAEQERADAEHVARLKAAGSEEARAREMARHRLATSTAQVGAYGDMASAAKGFFKEGSSGYKALESAEKAFRAVEFALSVRAMAQDAIETASSIAKSGARTATKAVEAVVSAISSLPFPFNLAAGAATIAALASIGVSIAGSFGGGNSAPKANDGTGTVLGDSGAKSESIKRSIDALRDVDTVTSGYAREMAASLRSIESQIGGFASLLVRQGDNINASGNVAEGFKTIAIGSVLSKIPLIGGLLGGLFGTKTTVTATGLYGDAQSLGAILSNGFDASYYSDVNKKKKLFGLTTSSKNSTNFSAADPVLENQFTLILRQFSTAIAAAAGPLGAAADAVQARLNSFVLDIGKIDLKDLTGEEIEEKLNAVFGAAADNMANAAFPGMQRFQKVGEGLFETLVRVASTVEAVSQSFDLLGFAATGMTIDMKVGLADQFDSVGDMTSAVDGYFEAFYTKQEQAAAKTAQFGKLFDSLGLAMPSTLASFRALVEAQDLTTSAGQATYATLLQLAPAFADLQASMAGAKSAADILSERQDLERKLLELRGDTAALRALDLAQVDASNRALQMQVWAVEDAREAAQAAQQLRDAWTSVGSGIMDEVKRIRGIMGGNEEGGFAALMGQFNAATSAARAGDQDMAKSLPGLSQALLRAAALSASSQQELQRVQAQTAASLEATYGVIGSLTGSAPGNPASVLGAAAAASQASAPAAANDDLLGELQALRGELAQMRADNNAGLAATAGNTGRIARKLDDVTAASGGAAISVTGAAA